MLLGYIGVWIVYMMYLFSVTTEESKDIPNSLTSIYGSGKYKVLHWDNDSTWNLFWLQLFGLFWVTQFLGYWSFMSLSGAFCEWYFTPWNDTNKREEKTIKGNLINRSMYRVTRFHLGTIAFGAAIIAIIKTLRAFLAYLASKAEGSENCVAKCVFWCVQCVLGCVECCIDKINKTGFIYTSIYGMPYCPACFEAFDILVSNASYSITMTTISAILIRLAKFAIAMGTTCIMILISMGAYEKEELTSYLVVGFVFFVIGFGVAFVFLDIFDTAIDSLFICFLTELDIHGKQGLIYASLDVANIFGEYEEEYKEEAASLHRMNTSMREKSNNAMAV